MHLTTRGRSAVNVLIDLALHQGDGPVVLSAISDRLALSVSNLEVIVAKLRTSGIVEGIRGPGGGYRLGRSPEWITVADIILAVEKPIVVIPRNGKTNCNGADVNSGRICIMDDLSTELYSKIIQYLSSVSLGDLVQTARSRGAGNQALRTEA